MLNLALLGARISQKEQLLRQASLWLAPARTGNLVNLASRTVPITFTRSTTATFLDKDGLLKTAGVDVPVIEYDANGNCLGLRVWGAVTNLAPRSEDFTAAAWTAFRSTPSANTTTSPNGQITADRLTEDTSASNTHGIFQTSTIANLTTYTYSVFVKPNERTQVVLALNLGAGEKKTWFNLSNGTIGTNANSTALIIPYPNGWFRIAITSTSSSTTATQVIKLATADNVEIYTGDGVSSISLFGAQLNPGPLAPYVPTTATAASSAVDMLTVTGADVARIINNSSLTIFARARRGYSGNFNSYPSLYEISDGSTNNLLFAYGVLDRTALTNFSVNSSGVSQTDYVQISEPTTNSFGIAHALSTNDSQFAGKGVLTTPDNSVAMPTNLNQINIGKAWTGYIEEFAIFRSRRPNRDLILLTQ